jgi:hypothetical protein
MLDRYLSDPQRHEKIACGILTTDIKRSPVEDIAEMNKKIQAIIPKVVRDLPLPKMDMHSNSHDPMDSIGCTSSSTHCSVPDESAWTYRSQSGADKEAILEESPPAPCGVKEALSGNTHLEETYRQDSESFTLGATASSPPHYTLLDKEKANKRVQRSSPHLHATTPAHPSAVVGCTPFSGLAKYYIPNGNIQNGTTTDSSWSSDESDSNDEVNCLVPPAYTGLAVLQSKQPIRPSMTTIQVRNADRLMKEFLLKLSIDWQNIYVKQHGPSSSSNTNSASGSGRRWEDSAKKNGTKRPRRNQEGQSSDDENGEEGCGRPEDTSTAKNFEGVSPYFACPYRKRNPRKYCVRNWGPCARTGLQSISRVK